MSEIGMPRPIGLEVQAVAADGEMQIEADYSFAGWAALAHGRMAPNCATLVPRLAP